LERGEGDKDSMGVKIMPESPYAALGGGKNELEQRVPFRYE